MRKLEITDEERKKRRAAYDKERRKTPMTAEQLEHYKAYQREYYKNHTKKRRAEKRNAKRGTE